MQLQELGKRKICLMAGCGHLISSSNMMTIFWASYSFCSSVISSMGLGMGSSTCPVIGLILEETQE